MALNSTSRTTKPNSRSGAVAGPSSRPVAAQAGTKRKNKSPEPSDVEGWYGHTEDEGGGAKSKKAGDTEANGKTSLKGKGKARAEPPAKKLGKAGTPMEISEVDEPVEDTDGYTTKKRPVTKKKATIATSRQPANSDGELSKLRQKLLDVRIYPITECSSSWHLRYLRLKDNAISYLSIWKK